MNPEDIKQITESVEKALPEVVSQAVETKFAQLSEKAFADVAEMKTELKKYSLAQKGTAIVKKAFTETVMVSIIRKVWNDNIQTEKGFNQVVAAEMKAMNEWNAGAGAELVFDQFSKDILKVINEFAVVNSVRTFSLAKGDKISLPKATNGITTAYVSESGTPTGSAATTGFITIDIYKAVSLVDMTDELLSDAMTTPDLYNLIVEFIGESQAEFLENEILNGTGTAAIEGILVNAQVNTIQLTTAGQRASNIDDTVLTNVMTKALMKYKRKASNIKWIMSQYVYGKLRAIKTVDGYPLYPELRNLSNPFLSGYAVIISDKAPCQDVATDIAGATTLIFWDLKYFTLVRRNTLSLEREHILSVGSIVHDWTRRFWF